MKTYRILVINPGSTSTKVSLFENEASVFEKSLFHDASVLLAFPHVNDQLPFRRGVILDLLAAEGVDPERLGTDLRSKDGDRKSTRLNSSHVKPSRMPSSA